ncbi:MAG: alkaline phosphatase family protein [Caldilineaceae bacterium]|nr:alkaline phosphatase family protein [Caldilineaceae bacterium]
MPRRIEIVCHRGANEYAPENTCASAKLCVEWGMDYVEIDVNRSLDGVHYLFHGPRLELTTNGVGLIHETLSTVIDQLDAGSWFDPAFADERVPRLEAYLRWIKGKAKVFFDVKSANLPEVVALVREIGLADECFWWSGDDQVMRELKRLAPEMALKVNVESVADVVAADEEFGAALVEVRLKDMSVALVEECRRRGIQVMIYHRAKEEGAYRQVLRWDADLINLDNGDVFARVRDEVEAAAAAGHVDETPLPRVKRAILFMLDGCRAGALEAAKTPTVDRLRREGAWTLRAQSVMPSVTLPCHTSIFYSQMPEEHGVFSNKWTPSDSLAPSLIAAVRDAGYETAAFYTWEELRDLAPPGKVDFVYYRRLSYSAFEELHSAARETIPRLKPTLSFVYLEAPDALGHLYGWMSRPYLDAVTRADAVIGSIMDALAASGDLEETLIVVMADHGGHGHGHGTELEEDMTVPWMIWGPGVRVGLEIEKEVRLIDVAPTLLYALGIPQPSAWQGEVIDEVFV